MIVNSLKLTFKNSLLFKIVWIKIVETMSMCVIKVERPTYPMVLYFILYVLSRVNNWPLPIQMMKPAEFYVSFIVKIDNLITNVSSQCTMWLWWTVSWELSQESKPVWIVAISLSPVKHWILQTWQTLPKPGLVV